MANEGIRKCLYCGKEIHWLSTKKFCDRICKDRYKYVKIEKQCECCWKTFMWSYVTKYCSKECKNKSWKESFKKTNLERYWVEYPQQDKEIRDKVKQTNLKKYWVENVAQFEEIKKKMQNTMLEKYWAKNPMQSEEIKNKIQNTNIKKYWCKSPMQNESVKEKAKNNLLKSVKNKYWVDNVWQIEEVKQKIIQSSMEKYWVPFNCMTKECLNASTTISKINKEYANILEKKWFNVEMEFSIWRHSYDLKVWNVLIEINPFPYHNVTWSPVREPIKKDYHYNKLKLARDNWYRCIMVRDWDNFDKIKYLIDDNKKIIYARNCDVFIISQEDANVLFDNYHLQWATQKNKNNIYIWLYYNNELVECMSFGKPRYNKNYEWEILRLCSHKDYKVVWWANKIFKHFLEKTNANSVISYCDMSKFDWKVYEQLWFKLKKWNEPSRHWYSTKRRNILEHITDNLLREKWYDQLFWTNYGKWTDNEELMRQNGYVEIYDCGQATFVWTRE